MLTQLKGALLKDGAANGGFLFVQLTRRLVQYEMSHNRKNY
jgi:hypothetical protein